MLFETLDKLNIKYEYVTHKEVHTILEADSLKLNIAGIGTKSLFLKDTKGNYYILVLREDKKADFKKLKELVGKLSFASNADEVLEINGGITPMAICNDHDNKVLVIIDKELQKEKILVHPNNICMTMAIRVEDIVKYIEYYNHKYIWY